MCVCVCVCVGGGGGKTNVLFQGFLRQEFEFLVPGLIFL